MERQHAIVYVLSAHGDSVPPDTPVVLKQRAQGVDGHEGFDGDFESVNKTSLCCRNRTREPSIIWNWPIDDGDADARGEFVEEGERGADAEHGVAEEHDVDVAQPLDLSERTEQVEVCDSWIAEMLTLPHPSEKLNGTVLATELT